ncbi:uncharacterized protein LOC141850101 [Brevipalpus obovatus]|uniref:uncharacterized protein LOC141850101 n=1 Tax=Brevipalpus obovatus TaxID=246614 RepID=UPI003D9DB7B0
MSSEGCAELGEIVFFVGQTFTSFNELDKFRHAFEKFNSTQLWIRSAKPFHNPVEKYKYLTYCCKAGGRKYESKSKIRSSRSYRRDCPFRINITLDESTKLLRVRSMNEVHECRLAENKVAFDSLPKQRRLNDEEKKLVSNVISSHGNTKALITNLKRNHGKFVTGKDIINFIRKSKPVAQSRNELEQLISLMQAEDESSVIITEESNMVDTIFFQDKQMRLLYEEYPEVLFCDATYKTNKNLMALMVFMVIDGNGESGLVALCFMKSESEKCTLAALESLKNCCPSYSKTKVIMGDKDMANRNAFRKALPSASIHICIFHVLQSFRREVTCGKRNLDTEKKEKALEILANMVYCEFSASYDILYEELRNLGSPELMSYFNENWHPEREQWTLFGQNATVHFENRTNNRLERFNRDLQDAIRKHSSIVNAFRGMMNACEAHRSERHKRALDMIYKIRNCNQGSVESSYRNLLTEHAADKVMLQLGLVARIFDRFTFDPICVYTSGIKKFIVDERSCQCSFFNVMRLPCRHIFALLKHRGIDFYTPELCDKRWYLEKFEKFKKIEVPLHQTSTKIINSCGKSSIICEPSDLNEKQKFSELKGIALNLVEFCAKQPDEIYHSIRVKLENFSQEIIDFINSSFRSEAQSTSQVENDLDKFTMRCICEFDDTDSFVNERSCNACQRMIHGVCFGILDGYSDNYNSKLDPSLRVTCHRCPLERSSDKDFHSLSPDRIKEKLLIRAALYSIVRNEEAFPKESNQIKPVMNFLRTKKWKKLLSLFFIEILEHPDSNEFDSFRYSAPSEVINTELDGYQFSGDEDDEPFDMDELIDFIRSFSEKIQIHQSHVKLIMN